ncbi:MAG: gliding motility-associated-like protein [Salibacteraceae bacterium]|jgi:gliding motility-associated-like protein
MRKRLFIFLAFMGLLSISSLATHNRAGEITYEHISGFTYRVSVKTYTNSANATADRCAVEVFFGDGSSNLVQRINGAPCTPPFDQNCNNCGENLGGGIQTKMNLYEAVHTFPGTGKYRITMEDPNRNAGVVNIPNSIGVVFFVYSELHIFPSGSPNSSPILNYAPVDNGCVNTLYEHNPGAVDQDISNNGKSDSLTYKLVTCLGNGGAAIPNYTLPDAWPSGSNNNISIDPQTGTLLWDSPRIIGEYNVAILITEWRSINGSVIEVGSVLRDLQITIQECTFNNNPPQIQPINDTCVTATKVLLRDVTAIDNDMFNNGNFHVVTLQAKGDPFEVQGNKATFISTTNERQVTQEFRWATQCNHVRAYPYFVVFRANDDVSTETLVDYMDWRIVVNGPAPTNIQTEPVGAGINVTWGYNTCLNAVGYKIYRKTDSIGYVAPNCETGIPASTGYSLIGSSIGSANTSYFDSDNGSGLVSGQKYCYMVYAIFEDDAESYPSFESCNTLRREVPIITRVSVNTTDISQGSDTVKWSKPTEIDTTLYPGPYHYEVLRKNDQSDYVSIFSSVTAMDLSLIDTIYVDSALNTLEKQYTYRIEVYNMDSLIGPSRPADSPWLKTKSLDNRLELSLDINVPWVNNNMQVFRQNVAGNFILIGSSKSLVFTDSNLVNGNEYCYYITTSGEYSDSTLGKPLLNNSQIACETPIDTQAPCAPQELKVESNCELFFNNLTWLNPNDICDTTDDVVRYNIYYRPTEDGGSEIIETVNGAGNTSLEFTELESVAGCYYVTAVDSFDNESDPSNTVCVDNCPYYELPNIFTPGTDGKNDYLTPLPNWRYVKEVDMRIYNRWGEELYFSSDPALGWPGNNSEDETMPDGVYFYVCRVYEIRLSGIVERVLKGTLTLLREESGKPSN